MLIVYELTEKDLDQIKHLALKFYMDYSVNEYTMVRAYLDAITRFFNTKKLVIKDNKLYVEHN